MQCTGHGRTTKKSKKLLSIHVRIQYYVHAGYDYTHRHTNTNIDIHVYTHTHTHHPCVAFTPQISRSNTGQRSVGTVYGTCTAKTLMVVNTLLLERMNTKLAMDKLGLSAPLPLVSPDLPGSSPQIHSQDDHTGVLSHHLLVSPHPVSS